MAEQEKNKIVVLEPTTKAVEELLKVIVQKGQAEVERVSSSAEVAQLTAQYQPCMLVACLTENGQVPDRVGMLKRMETSLKKGLVKTMFTTTLKNAQLANVITALGVTDFIQEPVPLRTMQFKANLQLKAVDTIRKAEERKRAGEEKIVFKKSEAAGANAAAGNGGAAAKAKPALQLREDSFLFKNSGVKKMGKKFLLELEGPAPETGEWKQHEDKGNAHTSWRWVPKEDENGNPVSDDGDGWVHEGDKPEFKEATGKWQFASEKPELAFQRKRQKIAHKVSVDENGEVNVAADSPAAAEAVERSRLVAKEKREKSRAKPEALRNDSLRKEKAGAEAAAPESADEAETSKKPNPALAMLARLKQGTAAGESEPGPEEIAEEEATIAADADTEVEREGGGTPVARRAREKKKVGRSPLDFLKQKMEESAAGSTEAADAADEAASEPVAEDEADPLPRAAREKKKRAPADAEAAPAEDQDLRDARAAQKSIDALARMKNLLAAGASPADDSQEEDSSVSPDEVSPEDAPDDAAVDTVGGEARTSRKKKAAEKAGARLVALAEASDNGKHVAAGEEDAPRTRREVLAEIQERINSPLDEAMSTEEEQRLRKKFGLEGRAEIKPKDLARKERLDAIKKLKELLEANAGRPDFEETAAPEATLHDLSDKRENTHSRGNLGEEKRESLLRAFDSEDTSDDSEDEATKALKRARAADGEDRNLYADEANYLPVAAVTPEGYAWEAGGEHYVWISGDVRYHGFERLEDLLPLWVFGGDKVPELLDKTQQWRFFGPLPTHAQTLAEVPASVRDFLLGLRDQIRRPADGKERAEDTAADGAESPHERDALSASEEEESAKARPASQAEGLEELFEKKKNGSNAAQDALDRLKNRLGADEPSDGPADYVDAAEPPAGIDGSSEETAARKRPGDGPSATDAALEKLKGNSPAFEKFLERRKAKLSSAAEEVRASPAPGTAGAAGGPTSSYLGVYVALSNSFGSGAHWEKGVTRVLKSVAQSFGACTAALLAPVSENEDGNYRVTQVSGDGISAGDTLSLGTGFSAPVTGAEAGGPTEILGYLYLRANEGREQFSPAEEAVARKAAALLWPVLKQAAPQAAEEKAA